MHGWMEVSTATKRTIEKGNYGLKLNYLFSYHLYGEPSVDGLCTVYLLDRCGKQIDNLRFGVCVCVLWGCGVLGGLLFCLNSLQSTKRYKRSFAAMILQPVRIVIHLIMTCTMPVLKLLIYNWNWSIDLLCMVHHVYKELIFTKLHALLKMSIDSVLNPQSPFDKDACRMVICLKPVDL